MSESNIRISLELADKAAQRALSDFISKSDQADKNLDKLGKKGRSTFNEIAVSIGKSVGVYDIFAGNLAANLVTQALNTMASGASALFQTFIVEGVKAAAEQEKANNALNVALAQTGIYSAKTAEEFQKLAADIQATTGVSDDAILTNAALLQSLGQLDKDGLKRATVAAVDLSAALGKDLGSVTEALGKAAAGNTTAIGKMGISFQKGSTDAETFKNILASLEDRFGGSAVQKVNTFSGSIDLAKASFGELQEEVGNVITQNNVVIEVMKTASKIINDLTGDVNGNRDGLKSLVGEGIILVIDGLIKLTEIGDVVSRSLTAVWRSLVVGFQFVANEVFAVLSELGIVTKEASRGMRASLEESFAGLGKTFSEESGLNTAREKLEELKRGAEKGFGALRDGASTSFEPLNKAGGAVKNVTDNTIEGESAIQKWALSLAKAGLDGQGALAANIEEMRLAKEEAMIVNNDYLNKNAELELKFLEDKKAAEQAYYIDQENRLIKAYDTGKIGEETYQAAIKNIRDKARADEKKADTEITKFKNNEEKQRAENLKGSLSYISSLQQSSVKELFLVGKAAALATAYIDAQAAVMKALASAPPPFNYALAAAVGAAAAVNIGKIASAQPPAFEDGGIVPGSSFSGDKVTARVNSGEMVINRKQQAELFAIANGGGSRSDSLLASIDAKLSALLVKDDSVNVQIGSRTLVDTLRSELNSGRSFT